MNTQETIYGIANAENTDFVCDLLEPEFNNMVIAGKVKIAKENSGGYSTYLLTDNAHKEEVLSLKYDPTK